MKDMRTRKCGCVYFQVGPPVLCEKHVAKEQASEEKGLRKAVREQAKVYGHSLTTFAEYESNPGKWTAHCESCGWIVIVYDDIPERGDQVAGRPLSERCAPGEGWASTSASELPLRTATSAA